MVKKERILEKCIEGECKLVISPQIIEELEKVLKDKFKVPNKIVSKYISLLLYISELAIPKGEVKIIDEDLSDNPILETGLIGKADVIVTGDKHLLKIKEFKNIKIIKSREFLEEF